jgi:hypothetical protein
MEIIMASDEMPPLEESLRDHSVSLAKVTVGMIPVVGGLLAEIVGKIIPDQRADRLAEYCRRLNSRLKEIESEEIKEKISQEDSVDLFESGALQSVRALSEERKEYIVNLVFCGICGENRRKIEAKRLLSMLSEIDDDQIIIMASYLRRNQRDEDFRQRHAAIIDLPLLTLGASDERRDEAALSQAARTHLVRLGLLKMKFSNRNRVPEFNYNTGMLKNSGYELDSLGYLMLRKIGLANPGEI